MDNLNETSAEHTEIEPNDIDLVRIVKVEREKILSDLAQLTQSFSAVFSKPAHRKTDAASTLESGVASLKDQYVQVTEELLDTVEQLKQLEQDNTLLSEANQVLTTEVEADTQVFETNQREIGSNLDQLTTEKEALTSQVIMLKGSIATKQAENEALVQEIEQARQGKISPKHQEDDMQLQISLLKAHAAIGDLFLDAKQVELAEEKDETVVAMENV